MQGLLKVRYVNYFFISNFYTSRNENSYEICILEIIFLPSYSKSKTFDHNVKKIVETWEETCFLSTWSLANGLLRTTEKDTSAQFIWAFSVATADAKELYAATTIQIGTSDDHLSAILLPWNLPATMFAQAKYMQTPLSICCEN
jgi:hypothetical protein